jgi:hypothetical protein
MASDDWIGGCQCGRIRYRLTAAPSEISACYCRMCQKAVGGPFASLAMVQAGEVSWTRGAPARFRSSTIASRLFCPDCGTPLAYVNEDTGKTELTTGSLDRPALATPTRVTGVESRLHWVDTLSTLPAQTTEELYSTRKQRRIVSYQHPDHDTPADWSPPTADPP